MVHLKKNVDIKYMVIPKKEYKIRCQEIYAKRMHCKDSAISHYFKEKPKLVTKLLWVQESKDNKCVAWLVVLNHKLVGVYVRSRYRRRGIARRLLQVLVTSAEYQNNQFYCNENDESRKLFREFGFTHIDNIDSICGDSS